MAIFSLRIALERDAKELADCLEAAYSIYAERVRDLPAVSDGIPDAIESSRVWVAEIAGQIVGGLILVAHDDFLLLENIAVRPENSGQGLGRALIRQAEKDCRELGLNEIRLSTHKDMPQNIAIYSRLGWKETGRSNNKVHMRKQISLC
jgi:ribosomal protein S18 acetylase RimI-like enzyme